jgi:hypothetical protein
VRSGVRRATTTTRRRPSFLVSLVKVMAEPQGPQQTSARRRTVDRLLALRLVMKVACSCAGGAACDGGEQGVTLRVRRIGRTVRQGAGTKGSCEASESSGLIGGEGELFEGGTALHDVPIILEEVKKAVAREDFLGGGELYAV